MSAPLKRGARPSDTSPQARKHVARELGLLWLVTLLLIRGVVMLHDAVGWEVVLAGVPFLFIYAPVVLCHWRGVDSYDYELSVPAEARDWGRSLAQAAGLMAIILVPWLIGYHLYQTQLFGFEPQWARVRSTVLTFGFLELVLSQVFYTAIPEEFFYRGYFQTRLNEVFPRKFMLFGIPFGHALWITSIFFAFGHSLVVVRWWHFAIFFPGLLFGLMREKTGSVLPGAFFHAMCNILVVSLDVIYGITTL
ncbi:MAG: CPBP family intramembrane metalloprotease [Alphaproteobacteria bacterium]|nr:CPBP family intramembrane metalloprotease [Alphaproteobacteria bacterium]